MVLIYKPQYYFQYFTMIRKITAFLAIVFLGLNLFQAQLTMHSMVHAGYVYQNQSFGEVGGRLLFLKHDDVAYRIGASALMGTANQKFAIIPKTQGDVLFNFRKGADVYHSYYFLAGAEATTLYIAPKAGLSLFGIIDLAAGYAFPFNDNRINGKQLKGINFNFTLNIPLVVIQDLTRKGK